MTFNSIPSVGMPVSWGWFLYTRYPIVARALGLAAECAREQRNLAYKAGSSVSKLVLNFADKLENAMLLWLQISRVS